MVKQNCLWEIAVRRRQNMHSLSSTPPHTGGGGKGVLPFANDATATALIQFCLTFLIDKSNRQAAPSIADNFEHADSHCLSTTDKQTERM